MKIGKGGFSSVYAARHKVDQQRYAIKKTVLKVSSDCTANARDEMHRMLQEVRLFAEINSPHIIRYNHSWIEVTEVPTDSSVEPEAETSPVSPTRQDPSIDLVSPFVEFAAPDSVSDQAASTRKSTSATEQGEARSSRVFKIALYIQMELCAETLEEYMDARESASLSAEEYAERANIASQIVQAIRTIHCDHGLIHRDLSLRNVFIGRDGVVKIGDFGLATRCKHLIPQLASPAGLKPMEPLPEEKPDEFVLEEEERENDFPHHEEADSQELTHGLGTKTFAAPEQMSNLPYDQKADIYSLGLILLALFSPTETLSERYEILRECRLNRGPSAEFAAKYPELAGLITRMVSEDPALRPTVDEIKESPLFAGEERGKGADWEKLGFNGRRSLIAIGSTGKPKSKFLKICEDNLLVYNRKEDVKAKFCYPLNECKITTERNNSVSKGHIRRIRSAQDMSESMVPTEYAYKVAVEHPQLETLYMFLQSPPLCSFS